MRAHKFREARIKLGLSVAQCAKMLETDTQTVRRMEMDPDKSTSRKPATRMIRLMQAYLSGYRPEDWPVE